MKVVCRGKTAYISTSLYPVKVGPTLGGGVVYVIEFDKFVLRDGFLVANFYFFQSFLMVCKIYALFSDRYPKFVSFHVLIIE